MKDPSNQAHVGTPPNDQDLTTGVEARIQPTPEQIRQRAYEIHKERGGYSHPAIDWLQAENELKAELRRRRQDDSVMRKISSSAQG